MKKYSEADLVKAYARWNRKVVKNPEQFIPDVDYKRDRKKSPLRMARQSVAYLLTLVRK